MPDFDALKILWPAGKRGSLKVAEQRWDKLTDPDKAKALEGAHRARGTASWRSGFIPHMATYLHQRRWEDVLEAPDASNDELTPAEQKAWVAYSRRVGSWLRYDCQHRPKCETNEKHRKRIAEWYVLCGWG